MLRSSSSFSPFLTTRILLPLMLPSPALSPEDFLFLDNIFWSGDGLLSLSSSSECRSLLFRTFLSEAASTFLRSDLSTGPKSSSSRPGDGDKDLARGCLLLLLRLGFSGFPSFSPQNPLLHFYPTSMRFSCLCQSSSRTSSSLPPSSPSPESATWTFSPRILSAPWPLSQQQSPRV